MFDLDGEVKLSGSVSTVVSSIQQDLFIRQSSDLRVIDHMLQNLHNLECECTPMLRVRCLIALFRAFVLATRLVQEVTKGSEIQTISKLLSREFFLLSLPNPFRRSPYAAKTI